MILSSWLPRVAQFLSACALSASLYCPTFSICRDISLLWLSWNGKIATSFLRYLLYFFSLEAFIGLHFRTFF